MQKTYNRPDKDGVWGQRVRNVNEYQQSDRTLKNKKGGQLGSRGALKKVPLTTETLLLVGKTWAQTEWKGGRVFVSKGEKRQGPKFWGNEKQIQGWLP